MKWSSTEVARAVTVGLVAVVGIGFVSTWRTPDASAQAEFSAYSVDQAEALSQGLGRRALQLPATLPPGVPDLNGQRFYWSKAITTRGPRAGQAWESTFTSDALGKDTLLNVYQDRLGTPAEQQERCRGAARRVVREVRGNRISICVGDGAVKEAVAYWRTVPFTDEYSEIAWLAGE